MHTLHIGVLDCRAVVPAKDRRLSILWTGRQKICRPRPVPGSWQSVLRAPGPLGTLVVRLLLLEKYIEPDQLDAEYGRTALSRAAGNGHEGVVRLLLRPKFAHPMSAGRQWEKVAQAVGSLFGRRYVNLDRSSKSG